MDSILSSPVTFPLMELPPELLKVVIAKVEDSKDVVQLRKAAPELRPSVKGVNRLFWLFNQVLPIIFHLLGKNEHLALRLVCKGWSLDKDAFLEDHPSRSSYGEKDDASSHPFPAACQIYSQLNSNQYRFTTIFKRAEGFTRFFMEAEGHPPERNPFVGSHVTLRCPIDFITWSRAMELLRRFGRNILFLQVNSPEPFKDLEYFHRCTLLHHLHHLPNLRSLHFQNCGLQPRSDPPFFIIGQRQGLTLPHLPHLEALEFEDLVKIPSKIMSLLLSTYGPQLRKLELHVDLWPNDFDFANRFPNLTELEVMGGCCDIRKKRMSDLLLAIQAPRLAALSISTHSYVKFTEEEVFRWLARFQKLVTLRLHCPVSSDDDPSNPNWSPIRVSSCPSLRFILFENWEESLNLDWLASFPELLILTVRDVAYRKKGYYTPEKVFGWEVWESLQNLNEIHIQKDGSPTLIFRRERKEYLERIAVLPLPPQA